MVRSHKNLVETSGEGKTGKIPPGFDVRRRVYRVMVYNYETFCKSFVLRCSG